MLRLCVKISFTFTGSFIFLNVYKLFTILILSIYVLTLILVCHNGFNLSWYTRPQHTFCDSNSETTCCFQGTVAVGCLLPYLKNYAQKTFVCTSDVT